MLALLLSLVHTASADPVDDLLAFTPGEPTMILDCQDDALLKSPAGTTMMQGMEQSLAMLGADLSRGLTIVSASEAGESNLGISVPVKDAQLLVRLLGSGDLSVQAAGERLLFLQPAPPMFVDGVSVLDSFRTIPEGASCRLAMAPEILEDFPFKIQGNALTMSFGAAPGFQVWIPTQDERPQLDAHPPAIVRDLPLASAQAEEMSFVLPYDLTDTILMFNQLGAETFFPITPAAAPKGIKLLEGVSILVNGDTKMGSFFFSAKGIRGKKRTSAAARWFFRDADVVPWGKQGYRTQSDPPSYFMPVPGGAVIGTDLDMITRMLDAPLTSTSHPVLAAGQVMLDMGQGMTLHNQLEVVLEPHAVRLDFSPAP